MSSTKRRIDNLLSLMSSPFNCLNLENIPIRLLFQKPPYPEYDRYCDPKNPKTILYKHVMKANETLKSIVPATPLLVITCTYFTVMVSL